VRTHAEHLAHMLNPAPLFERVGHCVPVGTDDKININAYIRIKKSSERFDLLLYKIQRYINSIYYYYYYLPACLLAWLLACLLAWLRVRSPAHSPVVI